MPAFRVEATTTIRESYHVEADSEADAMKKVREGEWDNPPKPDRIETIEIEPEFAERSPVA